MISHDKIFGKKSIYAIERKCWATFSSVAMLKGYVFRERLGTPAHNSSRGARFSFKSQKRNTKPTSPMREVTW